MQVEAGELEHKTMQLTKRNYELQEMPAIKKLIEFGFSKKQC